VVAALTEPLRNPAIALAIAVLTNVTLVTSVPAEGVPLSVILLENVQVPETVSFSFKTAMFVPTSNVGLPETPSPFVTTILFAVPVIVRCAHVSEPVLTAKPVEALLKQLNH
jgi:hypothetical protein